MSDYFDYPIDSQIPPYEDMRYPQDNVQMYPEYLEMSNPSYEDLYSPKLRTQSYFYERPAKTPIHNHKYFESKDTTTKKRNYFITRKPRKNLSNVYMPINYDYNFEKKNETVKTRYKSNSNFSLNNTYSNFHSPSRYKSTHYHTKTPSYPSRNVQNYTNNTINYSQNPGSNVGRRGYVRNVPSVEINNLDYYGQVDDMQRSPQMEQSVNLVSHQDSYHHHEPCEYCSKNYYSPSKYDLEPQYSYVQDYMNKDRNELHQNFRSRSIDRQYTRSKENSIKSSKINVNTTVHETGDKFVETKTIHTIKDPFAFSRHNYNFYESSDLRPKIEKKIINKVKPKKYEIVRGSNYRFYDCNTGYTTEKRNERIISAGN